jgi:uncharacterized protein (DUF111 family)
MHLEGYESDQVLQLETNLDDISPEVVGHVTERLLAAGALDVWIVPVQMKKQRPGMQLGLLCEKGLLEYLTGMLFSETTAFGVRISEVTRLKLRRDFVSVETPFGSITVKRGFRGNTLLQIAPEYESCRAAAMATGRPLHEVFTAARDAARQTDHPPQSKH